MDLRKFGIIPFLVMIGLVIARYSAHTEPIQPAQSSVSFSQIVQDYPLEAHPATSSMESLPANDTSPLGTTQVTDLPPFENSVESTNRSAPIISRTSSPYEPSRGSFIPTRLVIPSLKVDTQIVFIPFNETSWDLEGLGDKIAYLEGSPGNQLLNNTVLAGHVTLFNGSNGPFRYLTRLEPGSKIIVYSGSQSLTYQVRDLSLVYPEAIDVMDETERKELTLLTCTTWDEATKSYLRRLVVRADLVEIETKVVQD
jgi:LPXTG-site transpeptidase (sortase) family protein